LQTVKTQNHTAFLSSAHFALQAFNILPIDLRWKKKCRTWLVHTRWWQLIGIYIVCSSFTFILVDTCVDLITFANSWDQLLNPNCFNLRLCLQQSGQLKNTFKTITQDLHKCTKTELLTKLTLKFIYICIFTNPISSVGRAPGLGYGRSGVRIPGRSNQRLEKW